MKSKLLFTEKALPFILEAFGLCIDKNGFVLTPSGNKVEAKKIQGIKKDKRFKNSIRIILDDKR